MQSSYFFNKTKFLTYAFIVLAVFSVISCNESKDRDDDLFNFFLLQTLLNSGSSCQLGQNWSVFTGPGVDNAWESVAYGNGIFVAVSSTGTNRVMTSSDGENWTVRPSSNDSNAWKAVTFGGGKFVAVATSGTNQVMTSTDGINWTGHAAADDGGTSQWQIITHGGGRFVAVNVLGSTPRFMVSTNGETWTGVNYTPAIDAITHDGNRFVAIAKTNPRVKTSTDGQTWTDLGTLFSGVASSLNFIDLIFSFDRYLLSISGGNWGSTDGITWSNTSSDIMEGRKYAIGNGVLVGVNDKTHFDTLTNINIFLRTGFTGTTASIPRVQNLPQFDGYIGKTSIAAGDKQFVIVAKEGSQRIMRTNPCP